MDEGKKIQGQPRRKDSRCLVESEGLSVTLSLIPEEQFSVPADDADSLAHCQTCLRARSRYSKSRGEVRQTIMSKVKLCGRYVVIFNHVSVRPIKPKGGCARAIMCDEMLARKLSAKHYCNVSTFCLEK